jgi:hypothetical protein
LRLFCVGIQVFACSKRRFVPRVRANAARWPEGLTPNLGRQAEATALRADGVQEDV